MPEELPADHVGIALNEGRVPLPPFVQARTSRNMAYEVHSVIFLFWFRKLFLQPADHSAWVGRVSEQVPIHVVASLLVQADDF